MHNELINYTTYVSMADSHATIVATLSQTLAPYERVYSYILYDNTHVKERLGDYKIVVLVSKTERYNTLPVDVVIADICKYLLVPMDNPHRAENVMGYAQPSLDILVEAYQPLIHKLALQQHQFWRKIEVDDLLQMCAHQLVLLYRRGYYIHKRLLSTSFNNAVLKSLRKNHKTTVPLTAAMTVADEYDSEAETTQRNDILTQYELQLVQTVVTPATLAQLINDYKNKCTNAWTMSTVKRIRDQLSKRGHTRDNIIHKIFEE